MNRGWPEKAGAKQPIPAPCATPRAIAHGFTFTLWTTIPLTKHAPQLVTYSVPSSRLCVSAGRSKRCEARLPV